MSGAGVVAVDEVSTGAESVAAAPAPLTLQELAERAVAARKSRGRRRSRMSAAREIVGWQRLQSCGRRMRNPDQGVRLVVSRCNGDTRAAFCGLNRCGSVWICPECAAHISQLRAAELAAATRLWRANRGSVALLTLTIRHTNRDHLTDLYDKLKAALATLRGSYGYKKAASDAHLAHVIRAQEVTVGPVNGWHPHTHMLLFFDGCPLPGALELLRLQVFTAWRSACLSVGLDEPEYFCCDLRVGVTVDEKIAEYMSKWHKAPKRDPWGVEAETTRYMHKGNDEANPAGPRFSPFGLLDMFIATGDTVYRNWFLEYACVFKGQRQLFWSRGLRQLLEGLGLPRVDDADSARADQSADDIALEVELTSARWSLLCAQRLNDVMLRDLEQNATIDRVRLWHRLLDDLEKTSIHDRWRWRLPREVSALSEPPV